MKRITRYLLFGFIAVLLSECVMPNQFNVIAPGPWRAVLLLNGKKANPMKTKREFIKRDDGIVYEEVTAGELPFTFNVVYTSADSFYLEIINGDEVMKVDDIVYGKDKENGDDTIRIDIPIYNSYIKAVYEDKVIEGNWFDKNRENYSIPFVAKQGQNHRFTTLRKEPIMDISGKWEVMFGTETDDPYPAIGEFKQDGNKLTGTFLTETGDYRYLAGTIQKDKVYLSTFDGSHAFLFEAKIQKDKSLFGTFQSGNHYKTSWKATKNDNAKVGSAYELTYLKDGYDKFEFSFKDVNGNLVSSSDERFKGKAKIIQIFGTWCPNCRDETNFLVPFYENKPKNIEVIGLAFEKFRDENRAAKAVKTYIDKMNVPYPMLIAGYSDKTEASNALPMLNAVISYPTLIFIDKNDKVFKIHTGFNGPATSQYEAFVEEFEEIVRELTKVEE
ncbi:MAG: TlpA family protein disulfide reductase [Saprospiraceae bacterium]